MRWIVGDVQGCAGEFEVLLRRCRFDPARDEMWCLGDLVGGEASIDVLRMWEATGARGVIGNRDIRALTTFLNLRPTRSPRPAWMALPDVPVLMERVRALPVLADLPTRGRGPDVWIVHGGLRPGWTDLHAVADRLNRPPHDADWLRSEDLAFATQVRCCDADGRRSDHAGPPETCPPPHVPWDRLWRGTDFVVHGHWAARGHYRGARTMGLDSGCVHGGALTAWSQEEDRIVQVPAGSRA